MAWWRVPAGAALLAAATLELLRTRGEDVKLVCEATAWYMDNTPTLVLGTDSNVQSYVEACKEVFANLDANVKDYLLWMLQEGVLEAALPAPPVCPPVCPKPQQRTSASACARHLPRKGLEELGPPPYRRPLLESRVMPLRLPTVQTSEIAECFKMGKVARTDGRKLLEADMFNVSVRSLASLHPATAADITLYTAHIYGDTPREGTRLMYQGRKECEDGLHLIRESLVQRLGPWSPWVRLIRLFVLPWLLRAKCQKSPTLGELARLAETFNKKSYPYNQLNLTQTRITQRQMNQDRLRNRTFAQTNLNVRHLPNFYKDTNVAKAIGIEDEVLHTHAFLWLGTSDGSFHADYQDNVLIQLSGTSECVIVPPNCSSLVYGPYEPWPGFDQYWPSREGDSVSSRVPFHHFWIRPGDAVVMPSMSAHRIVSYTSERVGLNLFFEPKFMQMSWSSAVGNWYRQMPPEVLAVRVLSMLSLKRLWETRKVVMVMHTSKLEYI